jgi:hypothetical protein
MDASSRTLGHIESSEPRFASVADIHNPNSEQPLVTTERKRKLQRVVGAVMGTALLLLCIAGVRAALRTSDESVVPPPAAALVPAAPMAAKLTRAEEPVAPPPPSAVVPPPSAAPAQRAVNYVSAPRARATTKATAKSSKTVKRTTSTTSLRAPTTKK